MSLVAYKVDQAIAEAMLASPHLQSVAGAIYNAEAPEGMSLPAIVFTTELDIEDFFEESVEEMKGTCEVMVFVDDSADGSDPTRTARELAQGVIATLHRKDIAGGTGLSKCQLMLGDGGLGQVVTADRVYSVAATFQVFAG